jgi:hypothetical protein
MAIGLTFDGKFLCVPPGQATVFADHAQLDRCGEVKVKDEGHGIVSILFDEAQRQFCVPDPPNPPHLETRPKGAIGGWEQFALAADRKSIARAGRTIGLVGYDVPQPVAIHVEQRGNDFVNAQGQRIVFPAIDQFFAFRQWRDGGPDALKPAIEESQRLGFTCWRMWAQGSKPQNTIATLLPTEAGFYDDVRPCTDYLNAAGIVPLWTGYIDNQDVQSPMAHWNRLGERLIGSAALLSLVNQWQKNIGGLDINAFGSPGDGLIWSRGSSVNLDEQTPPRGAPASELHPVDISFERALMDSTASPINMREKHGSSLVWMTEGHPFGDANAWSERQAWQLARGYSIDWGLAVFHNRQSQRMQLLHDDTARSAAAWVRGMVGGMAA